MAENDDCAVEGWRLYRPGEDGRLLPPFVTEYWADKYDAERDVWRRGINDARCLFADHPAPAAGCFCGLRLVQDRAELFGNVAADHFLRSKRTILEDTGVLARVVSSGRAMAGCDMPVDDPNTTVRVERLRLVQVFLPAELMQHAAAITNRYGVPVDQVGKWWPAPSTPKPLPTRPGKVTFWAELRRVGFGTADLAESERENWLGIGESIADALRDGASAHEVARGLFDADVKPTWPQVESLIMSVLGNLAPDVYPAQGWQWSKPVTVFDTLGRQAQAMVAKMPRVVYRPQS